MSIFVNIGMWFERFVIIATTLARDYLPSSWSFYVPSLVEIGIFIGTLGIFFTFYLIFVRIAPVVAIAEIKHILKKAGDQYAKTNATTTYKQVESGHPEPEIAGHATHDNKH
jgi:molybdopterin-containing oxidoreductase family membrane subunit